MGPICSNYPAKLKSLTRLISEFSLAVSRTNNQPKTVVGTRVYALLAPPGTMPFSPLAPPTLKNNAFYLIYILESSPKHEDNRIKFPTLDCSLPTYKKSQQPNMMSTVKGSDRPESEYSDGLKTELTLALPGGGGAPTPRPKRGFADLGVENSSEDESSVVTQTSPPEYVSLIFHFLASVLFD